MLPASTKLSAAIYGACRHLLRPARPVEEACLAALQVATVCMVGLAAAAVVVVAQTTADLPEVAATVAMA